MKWSIIRVGIVALFMGMTTIVSGMTEDDRAQRRAERPQRKLQQYRSGWNRLIPKYQNIQYAGSMGFLSLGVGWDYGREKQWETEIMFGLVPRFSSNKAKVTFTLKQNYAPWELPLGGKWWLEPLVTGLYMNTVLSDDFWVKEPEKYPNNYYKFSTRVRFHVFVGQRIAIDLGPHSPFRRVTAFYELSTCDLYVISSATNKYVKTWDILSLSFGVKLHIL